VLVGRGVHSSATYEAVFEGAGQGIAFVPVKTTENNRNIEDDGMPKISMGFDIVYYKN